MDNVYCDGSEEELSKCRFDGWGISDCEGSEAAGVICARDQQGEEEGAIRRSRPKRKPEKRRIKDIHQQGVAIRLAGGRVHSEGRVEVKLGNSGTLESILRDVDWIGVAGTSATVNLTIPIYLGSFLKGDTRYNSSIYATSSKQYHI